MVDENLFIIDMELDLNGKEILFVDDIYIIGLIIYCVGCKLYVKNIRKFKVFVFVW